jgi:hypothetical protein
MGMGGGGGRIRGFSCRFHRAFRAVDTQAACAHTMC